MKHLGIAACHGNVGLRFCGDNQRQGNNFLNCGLDRTFVRPVLQLHQNRVIGQGGNRTMVQQDETVMIRIGNGSFGSHRIFSGENCAAYCEAESVSGNQKGYGIPRLQTMSSGKLFFHQAAAGIPFLQKAAGTEIRPIDVHLPFVDFKGSLYVISQPLHIHGDGCAGNNGFDSADMTDIRQILPGEV